MKKLRLFGKILKSSGTDKIICGFLSYTVLCAFIIWLIEPEIHTLPDALWYCFTVVSTIGFGHIVVNSAASRIMTVLLSIYAVGVIAILTAGVVNYFQQIASGNIRESLEPFLSQVEKLPDLSREEMEHLAGRAREFRKLSE